jgi:folate-binding protein YgfZ
MPILIPLPERGILALTGPERKDFLQGLVTNDLAGPAPGTGLFAALLSPQGKILFDFLLVETADAILIDCEAARASDLLRRLMLYRLRARVEIAPRPDWAAAALLGGGETAPQGGIAFTDPRAPSFGHRILAPAGVLAAFAAEKQFEIEEPSLWLRHRLKAAVPEGAADFGIEATLALEGNLDLLNGVSFQKGCYIGQELTARTHYRGKVRYRIRPVAIEGGAPNIGADVMKGDKKIGMLLSHAGDLGLARLRTEDLDGTPLQAGDAVLTVTPMQESAS